MWNTYSNALLELDESGREYVKSFSGIDDKSNEFALLKKNGFIVFEQLDELGRIKMQERQGLYSRKSDFMGIVIAPGMGCNYNCTYCSQHSIDKSDVMTSEMAIDVAEYVCKRIESYPSTKQLEVTWFGGEPLLYMDTIETISHKVIKFCKDKNVEYSARIITNGRLLDSENLMKLKEFHVHLVQLSIDGMCDLYCKSKGFSADDYNTVIDNLRSAAGKVDILIRINIPNNDANEAIATTDYFFGQCNLLGKIRVHFGYVRDFSLSQEDEKKAFDNFVTNYFIWADHMIERYGIPEIETAFNAKRRVVFCGKIKPANICISSCGELYKCHRDFGRRERMVGNLKDGEFFNEPHQMYCSTLDEQGKEKCLDCEYLPLCVGGCANYFITGFTNIYCEARKYIWLHGKLRLYKGGKN